MAFHAKSDAGNAGRRPFANPSVTKLALNTVLSMNFVVKGDGLFGGGVGFCAGSEEINANR
jgi:hypothetical protein